MPLGKLRRFPLRKEEPLKTVFVDTSAFYALFNRDDPHHEEAVRVYQDSLILVTTQVIFTELLSLLTKRLGKHQAIRYGKEIKASREKLRILHTSEAQEEKAWNLFCRFKDKEYDLVDCLSFVVMEENDIEEAFAFDRHFAQYGFRLS